MEITDVKIFPVNEKRVKAYASIVFDDCFIVRDLKVIHGDSKLFVAMPSKKMKDGSYRDTVHPLNNTTRQKIESSVLEAYEKEISKQPSQ
ncbi:MAG TPA: septation regulator SpoVG [Syntrophorhabdaceae bacterium]|nr:septation regulator SpoVG [Syntrophorhabdaceae bacterium]HNT69535.1 septation regulator SpoVG [Syntrophorhabdaceae bacterium]